MPEPKIENKKPEKEQEPEKEIVVVKELPTQPLREVPSEDGKTIFHLMTTEEALTKIMNEIEKENKEE